MKNRYNFKFIDLFAGIGGFHQAMTLYGGECVFASEIDLECQKQYKAQFKMDVNGDINKCLDKIPNFDVLCGGFPCQTFSKAGNQEGFEDKLKGQLFFRIIDILKNVPIKNMPNSFFGMLANSLNDVAAFIGYRIGESFAAGQRWDNEKSNLSEEVIDALWLFAKSSRHLYNLKSLLKNI